MLLTQTFQDVLKKGFLEQQTATRLSIIEIVVTLTVTLLIALLIFAVYRFSFDGVMYSHRFNASIVLVSLITAMIIMTIHSNIVLSLGMVGALSIVRFRTAVKEPMDIVYMFWSIAVGITAGSGLFSLALCGSLFIGIVMVMMALVRSERKTYILVVNYDRNVSSRVDEELLRIKGNIKSRVMYGDKVELTMKIGSHEMAKKGVELLEAIQGVLSVSLMFFNDRVL